MQEQHRLRQPKSVDALFNIAHQKQIRPEAVLTGNQIQNGILYRVYVLIFIYQYFLVFFFQLACRYGQQVLWGNSGARRIHRA